MKFFLLIAAILGFVAVGLGAFGAHALKDKLTPQLLEVFKTGVQYHFYHVFALIAIGFLLKFYPDVSVFNYAGYLFLVGIILFSGSLYCYTLSNLKFFAMITPIGGLCFITGWLLMAIGVYKNL